MSGAVAVLAVTATVALGAAVATGEEGLRVTRAEVLGSSPRITAGAEAAAPAHTVRTYERDGVRYQEVMF